MKSKKEVEEFLNDFEPAPYANCNKEDIERFKGIIGKQQKRVEREQKRLTGLRASMRVMCLHENKVVDQKYFCGDYFSKSYTEYNVVCSDCGANLFSTSDNIFGSYS